MQLVRNCKSEGNAAVVRQNISIRNINLMNVMDGCCAFLEFTFFDELRDPVWGCSSHERACHIWQVVTLGSHSLQGSHHHWTTLAWCSSNLSVKEPKQGLWCAKATRSSQHNPQHCWLLVAAGGKILNDKPEDTSELFTSTANAFKTLIAMSWAIWYLENELTVNCRGNDLYINHEVHTKLRGFIHFGTISLFCDATMLSLSFMSCQIW